MWLDALETPLRYLAVATNWVSSADLCAVVEDVFLDAGDEEMTALAGKWAEKWVEDGLKRGRQEGLEEGLQQGLQRGHAEGERAGLLAAIELGLELKFGDPGLRLYPKIARFDDSARLRAILEKLKRVASLEELQTFYAGW